MNEIKTKKKAIKLSQYQAISRYIKFSFVSFEKGNKK